MILTRYLFRQIFTHILIVMAVVLLLDILLTTLSEWSYSLGGDYQAKQAVFFVVTTSPSRIYDYFPIIVLIGCLTGLGALANSSELVTMRAAGFSVLQISSKVMYPALTILLLMSLLGETMVPYLEQIGQGYRAVKGKDSGERKFGIWHKEGSQFVYMSAVDSGGQIYGLVRYEMTDNGKPIFRELSETAKYQDEGWSLQNVTRFEFSEDSFNQTKTQTGFWKTGVSPALLKILLVEPDKLSLPKLFSYMNYLVQQKIDARNYELAFWSKVLKPIMTIALVAVAISFIFGPLRKVATGTRVFIGVLVGIVLKMFESLLAPACLVYGFHPLLAAGAPVILSAILGVYLIRRSG